ncbi:MAG: superoxide dismutase family protein [Pirellulaceae bacterium]
MLWKTTGLATLAAMICGMGLVQAAPAADEHEHDHPELNRAVCVLVPTKENKVRGRITFMETKEGTRVRGRVNNLTPGLHGFHIHQYGDLTDRTGASAGGHFNPEGHEHGGPDSAMHHAGDLGNIEANAEGVAMVDMTVKGLHVHFILGRSIVVHAGKDDLKSQPSGDAGPRVAVGVIGVAGPPPEKEKK